MPDQFLSKEARAFLGELSWGTFKPFAEYNHGLRMMNCYLKDASYTLGGREPWNSPHCFETGRENIPGIHIPGNVVFLWFHTEGFIPQGETLVGNFLDRICLHKFTMMTKLPLKLTSQFRNLPIIYPSN